MTKEKKDKSPGTDNKLPRLLMVDDSKTMRRAAVKMLGKKFDVITAEDGLDGWRILSTDQTIQVVFSDLSMPNLDGYGLLKKIRSAADPGLSAIPVVVVTGAENDNEAREKALETGATDFISKPFNSTNLIARATAYSNYQRITRKLKKKITKDELTGLYNKAYLDERLKKDLSFASRHGNGLTVVFIEIDKFNKLFVKKGKPFVDKVTKRVAKIILKNIRNEDTAARISLSQFVLSLPTATHEGSCDLADRIRQGVETVNMPGIEGSVTVSCGVLSPESHPGQTVLSVLEETKEVLGVALKRGGNIVVGNQSLLSEKEVSIPSAPALPKINKTLKKKRKELSIEKALELIALGRGDEVKPQLAGLLKKIKPLLELSGKLSTKPPKVGSEKKSSKNTVRKGGR